MNKIIYLPFLVLLLFSCSKKNLALIEDQEKTKIMEVMTKQENAWNRGDLDGFMQGYWKSESLTFIGSKGLTYGWETTLNNYKKSYPDKETMGTLKFDVLRLEKMGPTAYHMIGTYTLYRKNDQPTGPFTLIWEMIDGNWVITADHSS